VPPGGNFLGAKHTLENFETANHRTDLIDTLPFEQWRDNGNQDMERRAFNQWQAKLASYEAPPIDVAVDEALRDFVARKKASMPDQWY
jgi:trimethylamine--corrinoid protein Co-methyltransferase